MKLSTLVAAILGAVIAGGGTAYYYQQKTPEQTPVTHSQLQLEQKTLGEINTTSLLNLTDGVRSIPYKFMAKDEQFVKVDVSGALRAQISVLQNGQLIAHTNYCEECNSTTRPLPTTLAFKTTKDQEYQIIVSGNDTRSYGPFSVEVAPLKTSVDEIVKADSVLQEWAMGGEHQSYELEIDEEALYTIDMRADQSRLDPYLVLNDAQGRRLIADDDGGENLNARLQTYLKPGKYSIQTSSAIGSEYFQGPFILEIKKQALPENLTLESGAVLALDGESKSGLYLNEPQQFSFELSQPTQVSLFSETSGFYADIMLDGVTAKQQDSNTYTLNSILQPGTHTVSISSDEQSGVYTLNLTAQAAPRLATGYALKIGEAVNTIMPSKVSSTVYTLSIQDPGSYVIDMESDAFDTYLLLRQNGITLMENDDNDFNTNSRIELHLESGDYEVHATSFGSVSPNANYSLLVSSAP